MFSEKYLLFCAGGWRVAKKDKDLSAGLSGKKKRKKREYGRQPHGITVLSRIRPRYLRPSGSRHKYGNFITARAKVKGGSFPLPLISGTGSSSSDISLSLRFGRKGSWFPRSSWRLHLSLSGLPWPQRHKNSPISRKTPHCFTLCCLSYQIPQWIFKGFIWKPSNAWIIYDHNIFLNLSWNEGIVPFAAHDVMLHIGSCEQRPKSLEHTLLSRFVFSLYPRLLLNIKFKMPSDRREHPPS